MNRLRALAAFAAISATLCGCYRAPNAPDGATTSGATAVSIATATSALYPPGVVIPLFGIYSDPANPCCWLAGDAAFETSVPSKATHLVLTLFQPNDVPKLRKFHQQVTVTAENRQQTFPNVPLGTTTVALQLRPHDAERRVRVRLHMSVTFLPTEELGSTDTRTLSIYLKSVRAL